MTTGTWVSVESPYANKPDPEEEKALEEECEALMAHLKTLDAKAGGKQGAFDDPEAVEFLGKSCKERSTSKAFVKCAMGAQSMAELPDCAGFDPDETIRNAEKMIREAKEQRRER